MPRELRTEITIDAPPEKVWAVLTGFSRYEAWNPFITRIAGKAEAGGRLHLRVRLAGLPTISFNAGIDQFKPGERLGWYAVILPRLFEARHWFELSTDASGKTHFVHAEIFYGLFSAPVLLLLSGSFKRAYETMNRSLKRTVEKR